MNKTTIISIIILILAVAVFTVIGLKASKKPGVYDQFATCLKDSGIKFYGAFWCPHCADQKKLFGTSAKLLPYVECSTSDGKSQLKVCTDEKIEGYPTWIYPDGLTFTPPVEPMVCDIAGTEGASATCNQVASGFFKSWVFDRWVVQSDTDPVIEDNVYTFAPGVRSGETTLERLSEITSCPLPVTE